MVEFTWVSLLFMVIILGVIWGGFAVVIVLSLRFEKRKREQGEDE